MKPANFKRSQAPLIHLAQHHPRAMVAGVNELGNSGSSAQVSRGVSGSFSSATSSVPSRKYLMYFGKYLMYFGLLLAAGGFFVFIAFTMFLPVMVLMPKKFAICFTLGCISHIKRLPFTLGFIATMVGTIY
ncbi:hypothetical protein MKW92_024426, partial [Papaver armeniacum]